MKITRSDINTHLPELASMTDAAIAEAFSLHAFEVDEVYQTPEGETVFEIDVLPNRSSDSLSVVGLLRELAAITGKTFVDDPLKKPLPEFTHTSTQLTAQIPPETPATLYATALIEGVSVAPSPAWLQEFLIARGQRPINNIVDATNYVLHFLGQPTHAFDADTFAAPIVIGPQLLTEPLQLTTLDGEEKELKPGMMVIADMTQQTPMGIAGVKGGKYSAVSEKTTRIVLESARFDPVVTRKTARALNLYTDAAKRFENDIPDLLPLYGLQALIDLILSIAGGTLQAVSIAGGPKRENPRIPRDDEAIARLLGISIDAEEIASLLRRLGFEVTDSFYQAPWWRTDVVRIEDVAEEVVRLYGLGKVTPQTPPPVATEKTILPSFYWAERLRAVLTEMGFIEVTNSTLQDRGELKLKNALASDKNYYRDTLTYQLQKALDKNEPFLPLVGLYDGQRLFEIGNVYRDGKERMVFALAVRPASRKKRQKKVKEIFTHVAEVLEHKLGVALPSVPEDAEVWEMPMDIFPEPPEKQYPRLPVVDQTYQPFSPYPFVLRDIAVWVPEGREPVFIEEAIRRHGGSLVIRVDLFDVFEKDGRTSYAYHIIFQAPDRTLTDEEVNAIMERIEKDITEQGGEVR